MSYANSECSEQHAHPCNLSWAFSGWWHIPLCPLILKADEGPGQPANALADMGLRYPQIANEFFRALLINYSCLSFMPAGTQRWYNVDSKLIQCLDVELTLNRRRFNVMWLMGWMWQKWSEYMSQILKYIKGMDACRINSANIERPPFEKLTSF